MKTLNHPTLLLNSVTVFLVVISLLSALPTTAQKGSRTVTTGVPFLLLGPDARSGGVADAATGLSADADALHVNAAKVLFGPEESISLSYTPWMRQLVDDASYGYLSAYKHMNEREALGLSLQYMDLGSIDFRDEDANLIQSYKAYEFALSAGYMRRLGERLGMSLMARFVYSDLGNGQYNGLEQKPASAFATDVAIYNERYFQNGEYENRLAWGISISNIGTKLSYNDSQKAFLPMNLRLGAGYSFYADPENRLTLLLDLNKLLVPTPPVYDQNGQIIDGKDPDRSVASAFLSSFFDAPGGIREELNEFSIAAGLEYSYFKKFFFRTGYFYENPEKGNRQHFALGAGVRFSSFSFDMAYIAPTGNRFALKNTAKFTISYRAGE